MAAVSSRSLLEKMGFKNEMKAIFIGIGDELPKELSGIKASSRLMGSFDYIHVFSRTQNDLAKQFARLRSHLNPSGMLWVSWPKSRQLETDLDIKSVIRIGYDHHLVESKAISVNSVWSALKFTHPKVGKVYNNSYGKLPH
jgi:hypothetical protein